MLSNFNSYRIHRYDTERGMVWIRRYFNRYVTNLKENKSCARAQGPPEAEEGGRDEAWRNAIHRRLHRLHRKEKTFLKICAY